MGRLSRGKNFRILLDQDGKKLRRPIRIVFASELQMLEQKVSLLFKAIEKGKDGKVDDMIIEEASEASEITMMFPAKIDGEWKEGLPYDNPVVLGTQVRKGTEKGNEQPAINTLGKSKGKGAETDNEQPVIKTVDKSKGKGTEKGKTQPVIKTIDKSKGTGMWPKLRVEPRPFSSSSSSSSTS